MERKTLVDRQARQNAYDKLIGKIQSLALSQYVGKTFLNQWNRHQSCQARRQKFFVLQSVTELRVFAIERLRIE